MEFWNMFKYPTGSMEKESRTNTKQKIKWKA